MHRDDRLARVRSAYDVVAESYARLLPDASFEAPEDRGMINAFATRVLERNARSVVDAGCGSVRMTRSGFNMVAQTSREPGPREKSPQAVLLAQRPAVEQPSDG